MDWQTIQAYIVQYGYIAVTVGTLFDHSGLTMFVVVGAAYAKMNPEFMLWGVMIAGMLGSFISDVALFAIGRWRADWLDRLIKSKKNKARLQLLGEGMAQYAFPLLVFGRWVPWFGRFVPAAAGLRRVSAKRAALFTFLGASINSAIQSMFGYYAAASVEGFQEYSIWIVIGALVISFPVSWVFAKRFDAAVEARLKKALTAQAGE
ncbi:MAG: VTT domain-containing protein [Planctomycetes bacterium]|nr:VTT domain-containing protein [Planctomycetota bacterium]